MEYLKSWLVYANQYLFVFILLAGLSGVFLGVPWRPTDQVMIAADIVNLFPPNRSLYVTPEAHNTILSDNVFIYYPRLLPTYRALEASSSWDEWLKVATGQTPIENPYLFGREQVGSASPMTVLLWAPGWILSDFEGSWLINTVWHWSLAGTFMYALLRWWKLSVGASVLGSILWMFGQHQVVWLHFPAHLETQLFFPLLVLCFLRLYEIVSITRIAYFAAALVLAFKTGYIQGLLYIILLLGVWFWFLVWHERTRWQPLFTRIAGFGLALGFTLLLVGGTLFQSAAKIDSGLRGQQTSQHTPSCLICTPQGAAEQLALFVHPLWLGTSTRVPYTGYKNLVETGRYATLLPIVLTYWAWRQKRLTQYEGFLLSMITISAAIMLGVPGITQLIYAFPILQLGQATRLVVLILFLTAVLSARLIDRIEWSELAWPRRTFVASILLWGILLAWGLLHRSSLLASVNWLYPAFEYPNIRWWLLCLLTLPATWLITLTLPRVLNSRWRIAGLTGFVFLELMIWQYDFSTFIPRNQVFPQTELTTLLQSTLKPNEHVLATGDIYPPNTSVAYQIPVLNGYSTVASTEYLQWIQQHFPHSELTYNGVIRLSAQEADIPDTVRYIVTQEAIDTPHDFYLIGEINQVTVYERISANEQSE